MTVLSIDEGKLKSLMKDAFVEVLDQRRAWFTDLVVEALEETALLLAIKEGETSGEVSRNEIFALLEQ